MKKVEVVAAVIFNKEGKILCAQKSAQDNDAYKWEFPGGKVEPEESYTDALRREIKEELSVDIEVQALIEETTYVTKTRTIVLKAYGARLIDEGIVENVHHQVKWIHLMELHHLDWLDADKVILNDIINHVNRYL